MGVIVLNKSIVENGVLKRNVQMIDSTGLHVRFSGDKLEVVRIETGGVIANGAMNHIAVFDSWQGAASWLQAREMELTGDPPYKGWL